MFFSTELYIKLILNSTVAKINIQIYNIIYNSTERMREIIMNLLNGSIRKHFVKFLIPAISSAIAVAAYSLIDTIAIGQGVGADGTAACAILLPVFSIASFIGLLCGIGGCVLRSKAKGESNEEKANAYFTAATLLVGVITAVMWITGNLFQEKLYRLCGADEILLPCSMEYGSWIFAFLPSFVLTTFLGAFIRTDGSPRFVMYCTLIGGVINVIGDWLFVFPLKMGMTGAAIATVIGSVIQTLLLAVFILCKKTSLKFVKPYKLFTAIKKITAVGFGSSVGSLSLIAISFIANNQIMKYCGTPALALYGVLGTVSALFLSIFSGIGQAAQPIVSENYGAGNHKRCLEAETLGMKTAVLFGTVFAVICIAFPVQVTGIFMKMTPEVAEITPYILRVYSLSFIPLAINTFATYYLQSVIRSKMASVISLSRGLVLNALFLYVFPLFIGGNGIWWAVFFTEAVTTVISIFYLLIQYRNFKVTDEKLS